MADKSKITGSRFLLGECSRGSAFAVVLLITSILLGSGASLSYSKNWLRENTKASVDANSDTPLYLPETGYVELVTMGFNNLIADILWFNTINYFGKQFQQGGKDYKWLAHMCDLVTDLDSRREVEYEFCANMIAWEAKDFNKAQKVLTRAIENHPKAWRFYYLRGFNSWYFLLDKKAARDDLQIAARLPNAPQFLASLASSLMVETEDAKTAIKFLGELYHSAKDANEKAALAQNIKRAQLGIDIAALQKAREQFNLKYNKDITSLSDLVNAGIITSIPKDPFGGNYVYAPEWKEIASTSGERPLKFHGKDKTSGIFSQENNK